MKRRMVALGVLCLAFASEASRTLDLSGEWQLRKAGSSDAPLAMAVPGGVHTALLDAKLIPDPFWGRNELAVQWVGKTDWEVSRTFEVDASFLSSPSVILRMEGVDTFADVFLNGKKLGETENLFRRWDFDAKDALVAGKNVFKVVFKSADNKSEELARQIPYSIPMSQNGLVPHMNLLRKDICHGGWDWGLALMTTGFFNSPKLIASGEARIDYLWCDQSHTLGKVDVTVNAEVYSPLAQETKAVLSVAETSQVVERSLHLAKGVNKVSVPVAIENPKLWWPNGSGAQPLYTLSLQVGDDVYTRRLGLRRLEIVNESDQWGKGLAFRVNGETIFCKGANWIPCDAFINRQTPERYNDLLTSAVEANMNMIRIWGGGQFESDYFYDRCDELGILLWHDFMFSCALYPADRQFLANVDAEVRHQLRRLRDHASIALWCGDNECIGALRWFKESRDNRDRYLINYDRLARVLSAAVEELDPTRVYWPSSPCGGPGDFSDGWHNDASGDMHYWEVWHSAKPFSQYRKIKPRFCSEFGFQSFSSRDVALTFCAESELNPTAPDFEWHQKNKGGNTRILSTMANYFRFPDGVDNILYLSQVQQAMGIRTAVEAWRHLQPRCMGTIFWQLNDLWPVASWSSIEYGGKWKHLQHHAKRFYAPLFICAAPAEDGSGNVEIWAINDHAESVATTGKVELWSFDGKTPEKTIELAKELAGHSSVLLKTLKPSELATAFDPAKHFIAMELSGNGETSRNEWFFAKFKECSLAEAKVEAKVSGLDVELSTDAPAFFVWSDVPFAGHFDDNSFTLLPGRPAKISFKGKADAGEFKKALAVKHLRQTYR